MSANTKKSSKNNVQQGISRAEIRKAVKAAPNEIHTDKLSRFALKSNTALKNASSIVLVGPGDIQEQMTIHRPLGVTDCKEDDWVMTRTSDVHFLLARTEDPNQAKINVARNERKNQILEQKKLLIKKSEGYYYPQDDKMTRNDYLGEADKALKADKGKSKNALRSDYLFLEQRKSEQAIINFLKTDEARKFIESDTGCQTFRTRGGVFEDKDQKPINALQGKTPHQAFDTLTKTIFKVVGEGEGITVNIIHRDIDPGEETPPEDDNLDAYDDEFDTIKDDIKFQLDIFDTLLLSEELQAYKDAVVNIQQMFNAMAVRIDQLRSDPAAAHGAF